MSFWNSFGRSFIPSYEESAGRYRQGQLQDEEREELERQRILDDQERQLRDQQLGIVRGVTESNLPQIWNNIGQIDLMPDSLFEGTSLGQKSEVVPGDLTTQPIPSLGGESQNLFQLPDLSAGIEGLGIEQPGPEDYTSGGDPYAYQDPQRQEAFRQAQPEYQRQLQEQREVEQIKTVLSLVAPNLSTQIGLIQDKAGIAKFYETYINPSPETLADLRYKDTQTEKLQKDINEPPEGPDRANASELRDLYNSLTDQYLEFDEASNRWVLPPGFPVQQFWEAAEGFHQSMQRGETGWEPPVWPVDPHSGNAGRGAHIPEGDRGSLPPGGDSIQGIDARGSTRGKTRRVDPVTSQMNDQSVRLWKENVQNSSLSDDEKALFEVYADNPAVPYEELAKIYDSLMNQR